MGDGGDLPCPSFPRRRESSEERVASGDTFIDWMPEQACPGLEAGSGMTDKGASPEQVRHDKRQSVLIKL